MENSNDNTDKYANKITAKFTSWLRTVTKREEFSFIIAFLLTAPLIGYILYFIHLEMADFTVVFYPTAQVPLHPYSIQGFINPPWTALLIAPLALFPYELSRILMSLMNMLVTGLLVYKYGGGKLSLFVVLTSYPFIFLLGSGSVEWIPMLGLLFNLPILILAKPQSGALVLLVWFKQSENKKIFILSIVTFLTLSLLVWQNWPWLMLENISLPLNALGSSPLNRLNIWPMGIPFGLIMLYYAWKHDDELLSIMATWLLTPYTVYHSLTMGMALLATRYPRLALIVSIALYPIAAYINSSGGKF